MKLRLIALFISLFSFFVFNFQLACAAAPADLDPRIGQNNSDSLCRLSHRPESLPAANGALTTSGLM
jgi:hypothetical protein